MDPAEVEERLETARSACTCSSARGDEQEFPDGTLTLDYRFVHVLLSERALRVAAADAARGARQGDRRARWRSHYGTGGAADRRARWRCCTRPRAISPPSARVLHRRAARAAALFGFREARCRSRSADSTDWAPLPEGPERLQLELGPPDDPRPRAAIGQGMGGARARVDVHARARASASSSAIRPSSSRCCGT